MIARWQTVNLLVNCELRRCEEQVAALPKGREKSNYYVFWVLVATVLMQACIEFARVVLLEVLMGQ
jgi:hypothetical protein